MEIKILGPGCPKCKTLEKVTHEAVTEMGITANIEKVEDIVKVGDTIKVKVIEIDDQGRINLSLKAAKS